MKLLRALVVDDSSINRRMLATLLENMEGIGCVDVAGDGAEALRFVDAQPPDFITLDLEMPRLDGFEFLELLMGRKPLPVVVVSAHSGKEHVFRALELGAIDFLPKPSHEDPGDPVQTLREQLAEKVRIVRHLSPLAVQQPRSAAASWLTASLARESRPPVTSSTEPGTVIVIGASTGGPRALFHLLQKLHQDVDAAVVIAQHMPPRFTRTFAVRLDRETAFRVSEAEPFERLRRGHVYVCPGGRCVELFPSERGPALRVVEPASGVRYVPSADQLFRSAANTLGRRAIAVVLTGMGRDGADGVLAISQGGGQVLIESPETAVVSGMPSAARATGVPHDLLPLDRLALALSDLTTQGVKSPNSWS
jgi:two-component system chemotaxis response regulator CheB